MRRYGSLKLGAKTSLYVLTAAGLATSAAATYDFFNSSDTVNFPPTILNGVVRSSRALFTISSCVVDYKYSLRGLPADSEEYGLALFEAMMVNVVSHTEVNGTCLNHIAHC